MLATFTGECNCFAFQSVYCQPCKFMTGESVPMGDLKLVVGTGHKCRPVYHHCQYQNVYLGRILAHCGYTCGCHNHSKHLSFVSFSFVSVAAAAGYHHPPLPTYPHIYTGPKVMHCIPSIISSKGH